MAPDTANEVGLSKLTEAQREVFERLRERFAQQQITLSITDDGQKLIHRRPDGSEIARVSIAILNA